MPPISVLPGAVPEAWQSDSTYHPVKKQTCGCFAGCPNCQREGANRMRTAKYLVGGQGRLDAVRMTPGAGNEPQQFVPEGQDGPHESDVFPLATTADPFGSQSYNLNPMLLEAIRMSDLFWQLSQNTDFNDVVDQIYYQVEYVTPWVPGTHGKKSSGMQSNLRGVSTTGTPGVAYTMLLKLYILKLTRTQIKALLDHTDSVYIRALGFLYLRVGSADGFKELWSWFEPYLGDMEELQIDGTPSTKTSIGDFARRLLTDQDFFGDRLPRIPVLVQRQIDANLKTWQPPPEPPPGQADQGGEGGVGARKRERDEYEDERARLYEESQSPNVKGRAKGRKNEEERDAETEQREAYERERIEKEAKREEERAAREREERAREKEERKREKEEEEEERKRGRESERQRELERKKDKERLRKKRDELETLDDKIKALRAKIVDKENAEMATKRAGAAPVPASVKKGA
uniref:Pre-mRNA-splicing factor 38 n=1 Tax=Coccolithus braarudii TaxID=221442 RepID=A0A7S0LDY6_9EUKA|mmetsp:Transcript_30063/g.64629  ORF Transcript_30063/g.64629 Transcript_30063/m.64629 type:complete len:461 (+) Transcript_30063:72-1454(+)|eukprot:CAMPEP_0183350502 /NCGR_PEP_ID=MMETSP0164_2-20130417/19483_1 /TAXON_ID=221442 /ORGANISM="Coccolithus pelagicus ssp braarudi, Strain PLY182g" /LENGTH=460 /DNA_ID=CAMNT_0025522435 /DNA_START=49 /DNA_END=1431 /DNA_ORIENTATION=-